MYLSTIYLCVCTRRMVRMECLETLANVNNSTYLQTYTCSQVIAYLNLYNVHVCAWKLGRCEKLSTWCSSTTAACSSLDPAGCQSIKLDPTTSRAPFNTFPTESVNKLDQSIKLERALCNVISCWRGADISNVEVRTGADCR